MTRPTDHARLPITYVVECYLPGVRSAHVAGMDRRLRAAGRQLAKQGEQVQYRGSLLFREDEVMFFLFAASSVEVVRRLSLTASISFERIVEATAIGIDANAWRGGARESPRHRSRRVSQSDTVRA
jgi:hypothetical protein